MVALIPTPKSIPAPSFGLSWRRGSMCCLAGRPGSLGRGICKKKWASSANKYFSWPVGHELPHHAQGFWLAKQRLYWVLQVAQAWSNTTAFCLLCPLSLTGRGCHLWGKWLVYSQGLLVSCLTCATRCFQGLSLHLLNFVLSTLTAVKEKLRLDPDSEIATTGVRVSLICPVSLCNIF